MNPFYRVDSRLVHGQIISTWMPHLHLKHFVIVSDTVPTNQLQMSVFRMAIPQAAQFMALTIKDAVGWLNGLAHGNQSTMVLFETIDDAARLFQAGHPFPYLNIGNVHHAPGRKSFTNAVYLGDSEVSLLRSMFGRGLRAEIRSLPSESPVDLRSALEVA